MIQFNLLSMWTREKLQDIDKTTVDPESGKIMLEVDMDYCKGCGVCANECPTKCISMVKDGDDDE